MKLTANQINMHSTEIARDYLQNATPLNDSIAKLASERNLNRQFVNRLVEKSNQICYLNLFDKAHDKYAEVSFELADTDKVYAKLKPAKEAKMYTEDYNVTPKNIDDLDFFGMSTKIAEEAPVDAAKTIKGYKQIEKKAMQLNSRSGDNKVKFTREFENFCFIAKQAVLNNEITFEEMNSIFPVEFVEKVAGFYGIPKHTTEKLAEEFRINDQNALIKSYDKLSELEDEYIELHKEAQELYVDAIKEAESAPSTVTGAGALMEGIASDIAKSWNVIKDIPAKHLVGYPAAFLLGVVYQKSKAQNVLTEDNVPLVFRSY